MRAPWKRAAAISLAACGICLSTSVLSGCKSDIEKGDEQVAADVEQASGKLASSDPKDVNAAQSALLKTVAIKPTSPPSQIEANELLAQADVDAADHLIAQIVDRESELGEIIAQMDQIGAQLAINNINLAGYHKLEPKPGLDAIKQATSSAQMGGPDGVWVKGTAPVPALQQVRKNESDLQKQIQDLTAKRDELQKKRAEALKQADTFSRQSESARGKESTGFYAQASGQRKEAADDEANIELLNGQLNTLQQDLAVAQLQRQTIEDAVAGFEKQAQSLQGGWAAVQKEIENTTAFSNSLLSGAGATGAATTQPAVSLESLSAKLDDAAKQIQALRAKAIELLNDAFSRDKTAEGVASHMQSTLTGQIRNPNMSKLPEKWAWQALIAANPPQAFQLKQARVQARLARLYADQFVELKQRNALTEMLATVLKESGASAPSGLSTITSYSGQVPPDVASQTQKVEQDAAKEQFDFDAAQTALDQLSQKQNTPAAQQQLAAAQATLAYARADSLLRGVIENPGQGNLAQLTGSIAHSARMIEQYGWAQLLLARGDAKAVQAHVATAKTERDAVPTQDRSLLPTLLPAELAFPLTTQPTTEPTTEPATQPTEAAPAGAGAETPAATPAPGFGAAPTGTEATPHVSGRPRR